MENIITANLAESIEYRWRHQILISNELFHLGPQHINISNLFPIGFEYK